MILRKVVMKKTVAYLVILAFLPIQTLKAGTCDPDTQPDPDWGMKNGNCYKSCGALGGTSSFGDACSRHSAVDAGIAYDVPYCCKQAAPPADRTPASAPVCDPVKNPAPHWGPRGDQCLKSCGALGGQTFQDPCGAHGRVEIGPAY